MPPAYEPKTNNSSDVLEDWHGMNIKLENIENEKTHVGLSLVPTSERTKYGSRLTNTLLMAMNQVMKNLAIELAKRIVKRDESADHAELQF